LDNIHVNKLTIKLLTINICKLIYSCELRESVVYSQTKNIK